MRKALRLLPYTCAVLALSAGTASHGQRAPTPASQEAVLEAAFDCLEALSNGSLDRDILETADWTIGEDFAVDGTPRANTGQFRRHPGSDLLMMTPPDRNVCIIIGPVENRRVLSRVKDELLDGYPGRPVAFGPVGEVWVSQGRSFALANTGSSDEPAVRLMIQIQGS